MIINNEKNDSSENFFNTTLLISNKSLFPAVKYLKKRFNILYNDEIEKNNVLPSVTGLLSSGYDLVDKSFLDRLPNLKVISHFASGLDSIDVDEVKKRNIVVLNTPNAVVNDTADLAMAFILNLSRRFFINHRFVENGLWRKHVYPLSHSVTNKCVGIVGLGKIGKAIAKRCSAFNMNIHYWGRTNQKISNYTFHNNLSEMSKKVDFLVISCAGNEQTKGIIDENILANLQSTAYVINVARGFIIKQDALIISLQNNQIAGAGLDVFEDEPNVPHVFFQMKNVLLQPHAGSATEETRNIMFHRVSKHLINFYSTH
ncbi:hypothetical protein CTM94_21030 [Photobacterium leiognathi]|uniref:2-hydroxyacid dehydrogenase n=1 Tax=Photobacterium leiognathi TaxID=553611 RepID=A0ABX5G9G7_PHOLE|nr:NAD(P)-dependent oxidoreductase [Photobacterium leiognathi]PSV75280.1 hypothetical protein CTM94_21030 [Photobacterium leiognathi]